MENSPLGSSKQRIVYPPVSGQLPVSICLCVVYTEGELLASKSARNIPSSFLSMVDGGKGAQKALLSIWNGTCIMGAILQCNIELRKGSNVAES